MKNFTKLSLLCLFVLTTMLAAANNLRILPNSTNPANPGVTLDSRNTTDHTVRINFGLSWNNSWRSSNPNNYDAVWVYCKYWNGDIWSHVILSSDSSQHKIDPTGMSISYSDQATAIAAQAAGNPITVECGKSQTMKYPEGTTSLFNGDATTNPWVIGTVGIFLHRTYNGKGDIKIPKISLLWNYGDQNIADDDALAVKVFAMEMVYVPTGNFYLGGRGSERNTFSKINTGVSPYYVTSEDSIIFSQTGPLSINGWTFGSGNVVPEAGTIPKTFPKGYQAFYIMKYELTQEAYCDYLNTITFNQQDNSTDAIINAAVVGNSPMDNGATAYNGVAHSGAPVDYWVRYESWPWMFRYGIVYKTIGSSITFGCDLNGNGQIDEKTGDTMGLDGQDVAMTLNSFHDLIKYADFAGLRPMTEMEYEKACRGPNNAIANEFAWGATFIKVFSNPTWHNTGNNPLTWRNFVNNTQNRGDEVLPAAYNSAALMALFSTGWTDAWWNPGYIASYFVPSAMRVGAFATAISNRQAAGASYWGIMNMSDNVAELCYTPTTVEGRLFNGSHGSGHLATTGAYISGHHWGVPINGGADGSGKAVFTTTPSQGYIARGCLSTYAYLAYATAGTRSGWNATTSFNNWNNTSMVDNNRGMISDRTLARANVPWDDRRAAGKITTNNNNEGYWKSYLPGIRCVRTQNAPY